MRFSSSFLVLFSLLLGLVWSATIQETIDNDGQFSLLKAAIQNCLDCGAYTNPQGFFTLEPGNFLAVDNNGANNVGSIDVTRLEGWFFRNTTLQRPVVPIPLSSVVNDEVIPNALAKPVRFNVYGTTKTANGIPIVQEMAVAPDFQIMWRVSLRAVAPLLDFNAYNTIQNDPALTSLETCLTVDPSFSSRLTAATPPTTVLAPVDAAFLSLSSSLYNRFDLFRSLVKAPVRNRLTRIINYHLITTTYWQAGFVDGTYGTLLGGGLLLTVAGATVTDSQTRVANIIQYDIAPSNGVIHKIDKVLLPEPLPNFAITLDDWDSWQNQKFTNYRNNAQNTGFYNSVLNNDTLTGMTLIAPISGATNLVEQRRLLIEGVHFSSSFTNDLVLTSVGGPTLRFNLYESWYVNGRPLVTDHIDWVTTNGALHVYAGVFTIPFFTTTIWDKIPNSHPFKSDLTTWGFQSILSTLPGGYTVLLPDSNAWNALSSKPESLVRYHIIQQTIFKPHPGNYLTFQQVTVNLNDTGFDNVAVLSWDVNAGGCTNGMVVYLQSVLPPPPLPQTTQSAGSTTASESTTEQQFTTELQVTTAQSTTGQSTTGSSSANSASVLSFSVMLYFAVLFFMSL